MEKRFLIIGVICIVALSPALAFAGSSWTSETTYGAKATSKLDFGMKNLLGGWTTFFSEPAEYHQEGRSMFLGAGTGLLKGLAYTLGGALHTVTFPITALDIPLPEGGVDL